MSTKQDVIRATAEKLDALVEMIEALSPGNASLGQSITLETEAGPVSLWESSNDPGWKWTWDRPV